MIYPGPRSVLSHKQSPLVCPGRGSSAKNMLKLPRSESSHSSPFWLWFLAGIQLQPQPWRSLPSTCWDPLHRAPQGAGGGCWPLLRCSWAVGRHQGTAGTQHIPHPVSLQSNGKERSSQRDPQVTRRSHSRGAFSRAGLSYSQMLLGTEVLLPVLHITEQGSSLSPACPCAPVLSLGTGDISSHLLPGARGICSFPILTSFPRCAHSPGPSAIPCPLSPRPGPAAAEMEVSSEGKHSAPARRGC